MIRFANPEILSARRNVDLRIDSTRRQELKKKKLKKFFFFHPSATRSLFRGFDSQSQPCRAFKASPAYAGRIVATPWHAETAQFHSHGSGPIGGASSKSGLSWQWRGCRTDALRHFMNFMHFPSHHISDFRFQIRGRNAYDLTGSSLNCLGNPVWISALITSMPAAAKMWRNLASVRVTLLSRSSYMS